MRVGAAEGIYGAVIAREGDAYRFQPLELIEPLPMILPCVDVAARLVRECEGFARHRLVDGRAHEEAAAVVRPQTGVGIHPAPRFVAPLFSTQLGALRGRRHVVSLASHGAKRGTVAHAIARNDTVRAFGIVEADVGHVASKAVDARARGVARRAIRDDGVRA